MKRIMHGLIAGLLGLTLAGCGSTIQDERNPVRPESDLGAPVHRDPAASTSDARDERLAPRAEPDDWPAPQGATEDRPTPWGEPADRPAPGGAAEDRPTLPDGPVVKPAPGADEPADPMVDEDEAAVTPDVTEELPRG